MTHFSSDPLFFDPLLVPRQLVKSPYQNSSLWWTTSWFLKIKFITLKWLKQPQQLLQNKIGLSCPLFVILVLLVNSVKVADDWIRTRAFWCPSDRSVSFTTITAMRCCPIQFLFSKLSIFNFEIELNLPVLLRNHFCNFVHFVLEFFATVFLQKD